jgi:hypothetical protein
MTTTRAAAWPLTVALGLATLAAAPVASAYDAEVEATTTGQIYQLRGVGGDPLLSRRRVTQTVGLGVYDITGNAGDASKPELSFKSRMRVDADLGVSHEEYALGRDLATSRFVPGLAPAPVDVMFAYLEGRRYLGGYMGFKVGRQYVVDPLGWYAFDGALLRLTTPAYVAVEAYAGYEMRGGIPLSSARYEAWGVNRVDRNGYTGYPAYQQAALAPMFAVALESAGISWIHGRFTYRKAWNTGGAFVNQGTAETGSAAFGIYDQQRVSSERIGYGASAQIAEVLGPRVNFVYDLYGRRTADLEAGTDLFLSKHVTAAVDYTYFRPIFDADSIFNVFAIDPMDDVTARLDVAPSTTFAIGADALVRRYKSDDPITLSRVASSYAEGGDVHAKYKSATSTVTTRASILSGDQGLRAGGDVYYEQALDQHLALDGRVSLWRFDDKLQTTSLGGSRSATSLGYVLGASYRFSSKTSVLADFEHDMNRLIGQRLRFLVVFTTSVWG